MVAEQPASLADWVREQMEKRKPGMKQNELARYAGVSPQTVSNLLHKPTYTPDADTVLKLASYFGVEFNWLWQQPWVNPPKPILVPETSNTAVGAGRVVADVEFWAYFPEPAERGHTFIAVPVRGDCMAPEVKDGQRVIVDTTESPRPGDLVCAIEDGDNIIRRLERRGSKLVLASNDLHKPIPVDDSTRITGVVKAIYEKPKRGAP